MSGPGSSAYVSAALGIAWRSLHNFFSRPAMFVPAMVFPLFFFAAFAGGLSAVGDAPGFDYYDFSAFQFVFVLLQASALGGVFTGFSIAGDFEFGMGRRLLLGTGHRTAIVLGYVLTAVTRLVVTWWVITAVALATGMGVGGDGVDLVGLYGLGFLVNVTAVLFSCGVAMRLRTLQAGPLMQFPVFLVLFLAPVYVPQDLLTGWISHIADVNPVTALLNAGRALMEGHPTGVLLAFGAIAALLALAALWAVRGLRSAEAAG